MTSRTLAALLLACLLSPAIAETPKVLAHWKFDPANPTNDDSGNAHTLTLRGSDTHAVSDPRFGGALLIEENAEPGKEYRQGAVGAIHTTLNPKGAFTIDLWIEPSADLDRADRAILIDKKYFYNEQSDARSKHGYMLYLRRLRDGQFQIEADLGFGKIAQNIRSHPIDLPAGQWQHIVFTYDGNSICEFRLNGNLINQETLEEGGGPVAPSQYFVAIGDRNGSNHSRFRGKIADVKILDGITPAP